MPHSRECAEAYVIAALEAKGTATREDFDVPGIVDVSHAITEGWDFEVMERNLFWGIAASYLKS
ncbi:hypothetical protein JK358_33210 [Nocardia sp. 2]|uniref:Uncharacterized protein n=1 Tax=Nocardia acididurans TaxID=2802282 RepID=A0ABS1MF78_9NOCA|nr:hypothetical protein [Nocardia acididurans]MBL1079277.1 hypothetical protein [Nocardia acididurans]